MVKKYFNLIPLKDAQKIVRKFKPKFEVEIIGCDKAVRRRLSEKIKAHRSFPNVLRSAMDGFAIRSEMTYGATETNAVHLNLSGDCRWINTGQILPHNFDAVIKVEDTVTEDGRIKVFKGIRTFENVRLPGEDFLKGEIIAFQNQIVDEFIQNMLIRGGIYKIPVYKKQRLLVLPTGDEIVPLNEIKNSDQIEETNSFFLNALIDKSLYEVTVHSPVSDTEFRKYSLNGYISEYDVLVVIAGTSHGEKDNTAAKIAEAGELFFQGVRMHPGKPATFGISKGKPIIALPGYVAAMFFAAVEIFKPLLQPFTFFVSEKGHLAVDVPGIPDFVGFIRCVCDGQNVLPLIGGSSVFSSINNMYGYFIIDSDAEGVAENSTVSIINPRNNAQQELIIAGSDDPYLSELGNELFRDYGLLLKIVAVGSMTGLKLFAAGKIKICAIHLFDPTTGEYNMPYIKKFCKMEELKIVHFLVRQQGFLVQSGNPKGIKKIADLVSDNVRFINRQLGSGTRIRFDYLLEKARIKPQDITGYNDVETKHFAIAQRISSGMADVGIAVKTVADEYALDFVPLFTEKFDIIINTSFRNDSAYDKFLSVLNGMRRS